MNKILILFVILSTLIFTTSCNNNQVDSTQPNQHLQDNLLDNRSDEVKLSHNIKDYFERTDNIELKGKIDDKLDIHMSLRKSNALNNNYINKMREVDKYYTGTYYHDDTGENIMIDACLYKDGFIRINEYIGDNLNAYFGGVIQSDYIKGMWYQSDINNDQQSQKYQFYLVKYDTDINNISINSAPDNTGYYIRKNNEDNESWAVLIITNEAENGFDFNIIASWRDHTGVVFDTATYNDKTKSEAIFKSNGLIMHFIFNEEYVNVTANDKIKEYAGANVVLTGEFKR